MAIDSILTSVKKMLNITEADESFDLDILMHINGVFATLHQLGIGPVDGFQIEDKEATWDIFLGTDPRRNNVKQYVYLRVRIIFDPPATSFVTDALKEQLKELEWRLNVYREETEWVNPDPDLEDLDGHLVIDGGSP